MNATHSTTRRCRSDCTSPPTTRVVMRSESGRIWVSYHCDDVTHAVPPHELAAMGLTPLKDLVITRPLTVDEVDRLLDQIFGRVGDPS